MELGLGGVSVCQPRHCVCTEDIVQCPVPMWLPLIICVEVGVVGERRRELNLSSDVLR